MCRENKFCVLVCIGKIKFVYWCVSGNNLLCQGQFVQSLDRFALVLGHVSFFTILCAFWAMLHRFWSHYVQVLSHIVRFLHSFRAILHWSYSGVIVRFRIFRNIPEKRFRNIPEYFWNISSHWIPEYSGLHRWWVARPAAPHDPSRPFCDP